QIPSLAALISNRAQRHHFRRRPPLHRRKARPRNFTLRRAQRAPRLEADRVTRALPRRIQPPPRETHRVRIAHDPSRNRPKRLRANHMAVLRFGLLAWLALTSSALAALPQRDYEVKAVFLFNFTQFVDWPPSAFADLEAPFSICILGKDPFGRSLDEAIRGE